MESSIVMCSRADGSVSLSLKPTLRVREKPNAASIEREGLIQTSQKYENLGHLAEDSCTEGIVQRTIIGIIASSYAGNPCTEGIVQRNNIGPLEFESGPKRFSEEDLGYKAPIRLYGKMYKYKLEQHYKDKQEKAAYERFEKRKAQKETSFDRRTKQKDRLMPLYSLDDSSSVSIFGVSKSVVKPDTTLREKYKILRNEIVKQYAAEVVSIDMSNVIESKKVHLRKNAFRKKRNALKFVKKQFLSNQLPILTESGANEGRLITERFEAILYQAELLRCKTLNMEFDESQFDTWMLSLKRHEAETGNVSTDVFSLLGDRLGDEEIKYGEEVQRDAAAYHRLQNESFGEMFFRTMSTTLGGLEQYTPYLDLIFPFIDYAYSLYRSRNITDVTFAVVRLIDRLLVGSKLAGNVGLVGWLIKQARSWFDVHGVPWKDEPLRTEAFHPSEFLSDAKSMTLKWMSSDLFTNTRNLILSLVSLKLFGKTVALATYSILGKPEKMDLVSIASTIMDQIIMVCKFGESVAEGVPFRQAFLGKQTEGTYLERSQDLLYYSDKTYNGLPVEGKMCKREFVMKVNALLVEGKRVLEATPTTSPTRSFVKRQLLALQNAQFTANQYDAGQRREPPFAIVLWGAPDIGKSAVLEYLGKLWSFKKGRKFDMSHMYTRVNTSDYFEGYDPDSNPIVHYSELGSLHEDIAKAQGDPLVSELLSMIDSLPMTVDMAFELKGKVHAKPELILIDTNVPDLNLTKIVNNPAAFARRFLYIEMKVKPEFADEIGVGIDKKKSLAHNSPIMDRWNFDIKGKKADDNKRSRPISYLPPGTTHCDIYTLTSIVGAKMEEHIGLQGDIKDKLTGTVDVQDYLIRPEERSALTDTFTAISENEESKEVLAESGDFIPETVTVWKETFSERVTRWCDTTLNTSFYFGFGLALTLGLFFWKRWSAPRPSFLPDWLLGLMGTPLLYLLVFKPAAGILGTIIAIACWWTPKPEAKTVTVTTTVAQSFLSSYNEKVWNLFHFHRGRSPVGTALESAWWQKHGKKVTTVFKAATGLLVVAAGAGLVMKAYKKKRRWGVPNEGYEQEVYAEDEPRCRCLSCLQFPEPTRAVNHHTFSCTCTECKLQRGFYGNDGIYNEAHTSFVNQSPVDIELNAAEEKMAAGTSVTRIPIKGEVTVWNSRVEYGDQYPHKDTFESLMQRINLNVRKTKIVDGDHVGCTYILGIKGNFGIINTHALRGVKKILLQVSRTGNLNNTTTFQDVVVEPTLRRDLGHDITVIRLPGIQFKDISSHLSDGVFLEKHYNGFFGGRHTAVEVDETPSSLKMDDGNTLYLRLVQYYFPEHYRGACGMPLVIEKNTGKCVAAIHTGGREGDTSGWGTFVVKKPIVDAIEELEKVSLLMPLHSRGTLRTESLEMPIPQSIVRHEPLHGLEYLGKVPGKVLANQESKLTRNKWESEIYDLFYEELGHIPQVTMVPPLLKPIRTKDGYLSPYNNTMRKMTKQKGSLCPIVLEKVVEEYSNHIISSLAAKGITKLAPLTLEVAINGVETDGFIRRMNVNTSAGYGYSGLKSKFLPKVVDEPGKLIREPVEVLRERIVKILDAYDKGETAGNIIEGQLKDEPRDIEKVRLGKTRMFYVSPVDNIIIGRMLLAPFFTLMVEHGEAFGSGVGVNTHAGADRLAKAMLAFSKLGIDGDFREFDTSMAFEIGHAAASVIYNVLKRLGYNDYALRLVRGYLTENLFPVIMVLCDLYVAAAVQISGKYGTTEENVLRNMLIALYTWFRQKKLADTKFFENVLGSDVGDDLFMAVKEEVIEFFNNETIARVCREELLMEYTSTAKDGSLRKWCNILDCSFLKRKFVYRQDLDRWVMPLDLDSLFKSLQWTIPSKVVSPRHQMAATVESLLWELVFHCNAEQHETIRVRITSLFEKFYTHRETVSFPTFGKIVKAMLS